jgi:hypothetical protein
MILGEAYLPIIRAKYWDLRTVIFKIQTPYPAFHYFIYRCTLISLPDC